MMTDRMKMLKTVSSLTVIGSGGDIHTCMYIYICIYTYMCIFILYTCVDVYIYVQIYIHNMPPNVGNPVT